MSQAQAPAARTLGDVLADIKRHRDTCAAEQVPTSSEKLLELHTEALGLIEAAQAKPAAKTTKAR